MLLFLCLRSSPTTGFGNTFCITAVEDDQMLPRRSCIPKASTAQFSQIPWILRVLQDPIARGDSLFARRHRGNGSLSD